MQFTVSFELNIDIGIKYIPNIKTSSEYHWNHNRKQDRINEDYYNTGIYLPVYLHLIKEFVCVKDSTCQRVATSSICRSIFGVLFIWQNVNIRKQNHLTKHKKVSMCSLKCGDIPSYGSSRNIIFKTAHW